MTIPGTSDVFDAFNDDTADAAKTAATADATATDIPVMGLGTFRLKGPVVVEAVTHALALGYRLIDTAQFYGNEADIGRAIAHQRVPRSDIFLTTKVWPDNYRRLLPSLKDSLAHLRVEQVDLALLHWPAPQSGIPLAETVAALMDAQDQGLVARIGVSNFNTTQLQQAIDVAGAGRIATNQVELSPLLQNRVLAAFAAQRGVHITSYMTLAYGKVLHEPVLQTVAQRHGATTAQVALAWAIKKGYAVIPSSTQRGHLESNLHAQKLRLSQGDMDDIAGCDRGLRLANPEGLAPVWD